jgi:hypothetical protein
MIKKYSDNDFEVSKSHDLLRLECVRCGNDFSVKKFRIKYALNGCGSNKFNFCSRECSTQSLGNEMVNCKECGCEFIKKRSQMKKTSSNFCSRSCSTTYNNKHKSHGNRRSKLEIWLEEQLILLYPKLTIHFNRKDTINSELDIYIPSLNVAFELNGIFHYEPIYGVDKLGKIMNSDINKTKACHDAKIDLCIIDTSSQSYFKPNTSQKYLDIIVDTIKKRLDD